MDFWEKNAPLMSLQYVKRWALIRMDRDQTVGDHAFRVWVLARDLYSRLYPIAHNSFERQSVELWALIHDADEHWISDLPGHVKGAINKATPGVFERYTEAKFKQVMPWYLETKRGIANTVVEPIVKICDLVESGLYIQQHGCGDEQRKLVMEYLDKRLGEVLRDCHVRFATLSWDLVPIWWEEVLRGCDRHEKLRLTE